MDYLTRSGIRKQVKFASDIARPDPKPVVKEIELFNAFNRRNPKADGGRLVQPGFGGTRQGYRSEKAIKAAQQAGNVAKTKARFDKIGKAFIEQDFSSNKNAKSFGEDERMFETTVKIKVLGFLIGEGNIRAKPKVSIRENRVQVRISNERVVVGEERPWSHDDFDYRD